MFCLLGFLAKKGATLHYKSDSDSSAGSVEVQQEGCVCLASLGPVLPNETVAAFVPNFAGAVTPVTVRILDGEPTAAAVDRPVLRQAAGVVHWLKKWRRASRAKTSS